jgi:sterol desaturase/sphingolipid hydroxylase (fatty acid hydroxylase superfamily)
MGVRTTIFISLLILFTVLQIIIPSRKPYKGRVIHMASNLGLVGINNIMLMLFPLLPLSVSYYAFENSFGLFNNVNPPEWSSVILQVLILDMIIYFQHRMFHKVNWLWALHSVHHIDPMLDVTSGLRFHPFEIIISNFIKIGFVFILGIHPLSVLIFEVSLNGFAMFNHSNIRLSNNIEWIVSKVFITPSLHTIHHSKIAKETNSNYGFSIILWDVIFKTFIKNGKYSMEKIRIGVVGMPETMKTGFPYYLIYPFKKK